MATEPYLPTGDELDLIRADLSILGEFGSRLEDFRSLVVSTLEAEGTDAWQTKLAEAAAAVGMTGDQLRACLRPCRYLLLRLLKDDGPPRFKDLDLELEAASISGVARAYLGALLPGVFSEAERVYLRQAFASSYPSLEKIFTTVALRGVRSRQARFSSALYAKIVDVVPVATIEIRTQKDEGPIRFDIDLLRLRDLILALRKTEQDLIDLERRVTLSPSTLSDEVSAQAEARV